MIKKILEINGGHISKETSNILSSEPEFVNLIIQELDYGWMLSECEDTNLDADNIPDDLKDIMLKARQLECDYVILDADAECFDGLAVYNWD